MRELSIPKHRGHRDLHTPGGRGFGMLLFTMFVLACTACTQHVPPRDPSLVIELRWVKAYPRERKAHVETGLAWTLSFLGASFPSDSPRALTWHGDQITVDLDAAGVIPATRPAWRKLVAALTGSAEYRAFGAIDIGRFSMLTLGSSNHYYALTGASSRYDGFRERYSFEPKHVAISPSTVSHGDRLIEVGRATAFEQIGFIAYEGPGSIAGGSFVKEEIEALDLMPNGQLRFALYDLAGHLKPATSTVLTTAGKPAKCLWCHELTLMKPFTAVPDVPGYYLTREFAGLIDERTRLIEAERRRLASRFEIDRKADHTHAELLYISFMEPSRERLAAEWNLPVSEVERRLAGHATHAHHEFTFLGNELYRRDDVDRLAPYATLQVPASPREPSPYEPDLLR